MHFLQKLSAGVVASVLTTALFGMVLAAGLVNVINKPDTIKSALSDSNVYQNIVKAVLENQKEDTSAGDATLSLNEPEVIAAAEKAFSPEFLQRSTEQFLDSLHPWLEGDVAEPDFAIDISQAKSNFIDTVVANARKRVNSLPVCRAGQVPNSFEPFSASCRPVGMNTEQELSKFRNSLDSGEIFLSDDTVTAQTFKPKGAKETAFTTDLKELPEAYQRLKSLPVILALTAAVAAVALILLSPDKRRGVRRVGLTLLIVGGLLLIGAVVANFLIDRAGEIAISGGDVANALKDSAVKVADKLGDAVRGTYLKYGIAFIVLGAAALTALRFTAQKSDSSASPESPTKPTA